MKQAKLQLSLAVSLALASGPLLALGLGQIEVKSRLSQPLLAEIPIASSNPSELESLSVTLASPDAFARVGLDRPLFLSANLEFSVGRNERGENVIRVSTAKPVDDPFVSFLIEADWGSGKLVREFSVLLDPPYLAPSPRAPVRPARVDAAPATVPAPAASPTPSMSTAARQTPLPAPAAPAIAPAALSQVGNGQFGPVARGQTLSEIAGSLRPDGVGLNQMMVALLRANAGAFIHGNINLLKRGAILRIPTADELASLSASDAAAIVREQTEAWQGGREPQLQPIDSIAATPSAPTSGKPAADGRLSIVPPAGAQAQASQSGASAGGAGNELRAALSEARENLAARDGEIKELRSRVTDLEKLRDANNKLVALKDSELAALQQRLRELEQARSADAARAAGETSPAATGADVARTDTAAKPAADADAAVVDADKVAKPAPATSQARPEAIPVPPPAAPATPWYMQTMTLAGLGVIVVGLLSLLLLRRKGKTSPGIGTSRKRASDAGSLAASIDALRGKQQNDDDASTQPSPDEERLRELRANVVTRPDQLEAHLALLRYLHAHDMAEAFEDAATDMLPHVLDPNGPQWREACSLGSSLMPDNALFDLAAADADDYPRDEQVASEQAAASPEHDQDEHDDETGAHAGPDDDEFERALAEFDLEQPQREAAASSAWDDADAGAGPAGGRSVAGVQPLPDAESAAGPAADSGHDAGDGQVDDEGFDTAGDGEHDAAETKLDLAQAYIDIGDNEAAHALLDEVLTEGNASQRLRAERLLADLR